jgi:hypothetical protein
VYRQSEVVGIDKNIEPQDGEVLVLPFESNGQRQKILKDYTVLSVLNNPDLIQSG